ncbi:MAG TPA: hypothetical protein DGG94_00620 [Micromonosporaceae bacterium]|nr:hypothetical protein [Micromonosporaceae bacterium]HCU48335.1 hypothetical protein [Micromonosporaceae bacterium]
MMWHSGSMLMMMASMTVLALLVLGAVVFLVVWATRTATSGHASSGVDDAEQVLRRRYAAGEVDDEEYQRKLATLRGPAPPL